MDVGRFKVSVSTGFQINLFGPFEALDSTGAVVPVASKRGKVLLAALATGRKHQRTRDWMQALLWQGRGKVQASASLRQELRLIRKAFGGADVILSDHGVLSLNSDLVSLTERPKVGPDRREFLEGLDLPEPVAGWLAEQRAQVAWAPVVTEAPCEATPPDHSEPRVYFNRISPDEMALEVANEVFQAQIEKGLTDLAPLDVRHGTAAEADAQAVHLKTQILQSGQETLLRVVLPGAQLGQRNWTASWRGLQDAILACEDEELLQLSLRAQETAIEALTLSEGRKSQLSASLLGFRALRNIFAMARPDLEQADRDLAAAYERVPKGVYLAWRAFIQANLIVESTDLDPGHQAELAANLARRALHEEPENAASKAAASHVFLLTGQDVMAAGELARDSARLNPSNPLAWASWANAKIAVGEIDASVEFSRKALQIGRFSRSRHWWEMQAGVSAALSGNFDAARDHSRMAHSLVPSFRPPVRYLAALEQKRGDSDAVEVLVGKMRQMEDGFDIKDLSEPEYPSGNLRRAGLA